MKQNRPILSKLWFEESIKSLRKVMSSYPILFDDVSKEYVNKNTNSIVVQKSSIFDSPCPEKLFE